MKKVKYIIGQRKDAAGNFEFYFQIDDQDEVRVPMQNGKPPFYDNVKFTYGFTDRREIRFRNIFSYLKESFLGIDLVFMFLLLFQKNWIRHATLGISCRALQ